MRTLDRSRRLSHALTTATGGPSGRCVGGSDAEALVNRLTASLGMQQVRVMRGFLPGETSNGRCIRASVAIFGTYFVYLDLVARPVTG